MLNVNLKKYSKKLYNGCIILLANVYGRTNMFNFNKLRLESEFFSEAEFDCILSALKKNGYDVLCYFDENKFIQAYLNDNLSCKEFIVFNLARNGSGIGKKSLIPSFCSLNNIKYTSSNAYACSLSRHKFHVNLILKSLGLNSLECYTYDERKWNNVFPYKFNKKYIIKPLNESASQGISNNSIVMPKSMEEFNQLVSNKYKELNCTPLIVQQFIQGFEAKTTIIQFEKTYAFEPVGVEIMGDKNLGDKIINEELAFNYQHKNYNLSDVLDKTVTDKIKQQALIVFEELGMQNYGRIDCRIDSINNEIYFMDFSTMPYFVSDGEVLYSFKQFSLDISNVLNCIINSALISKYNYSL